MKFIAASIAVFLCIGLAVQSAPAEEKRSAQEYVEEKRDVNNVGVEVGDSIDLELVGDDEGDMPDDEGELEDDYEGGMEDDEDEMNMEENAEVGARKKRSIYRKSYKKHHYGYKRYPGYKKRYPWIKPSYKYFPYYPRGKHGYNLYYKKPYYGKYYYPYGKRHGYRKW